MANASATPGSFMQDGVVGKFNKSAAAITKGDVCYLDPADDMWKKAPTSAKGDFAVAVKDFLAADTQAELCYEGHVTVTADGTIKPHNPVAISAATAGQVIEYAATAVSAADTTNITNARDEHLRIVGFYVGKPNNNEREGGVLTDAADGDVIIVKLGRSRG